MANERPGAFRAFLRASRRWFLDESNDDEEETEAQARSQGPLQNVLSQEINMATSASDETLKRARAKNGRTVNTVSMLAGREINSSKNGKFSRAEACHVSSRILPDKGPEILERKSSRLYISQFSNDGSLFIAGFQDRTIVVYDADNNWTIHKRVKARNMNWTITDTALSPDQRFLVYASITPVVFLVNLGNETGGIDSLANVTDIHEGLSLSSYDDDGDFGIWSLKFSQDGNEIVAGSNDNCIYVYDLNSATTTYRVSAHNDEVNTVAFADESSHLIYSGSDDYLCKVWDRRCFSANNKPAGELVGHLGGVTSIDSRGDGRHFISNSKDQSIKLWDIRTMSGGSKKSFERAQVPRIRWDYRCMRVPPRLRTVAHPGDESLMTYKGHEVLQTLIRCYFSPRISTGQKYIYTGSYDGTVHIYDVVTGHTAATLSFHNHPVRDCSWHPWQPVLVSSCWGGNLVKWDHDPRSMDF
ncbi:LEC14B protein [Selaginella moellendorffii]|uniref:LEC14B protein n=1 Tax=Selaginella moellendorffii TaxID=88036 RepID=UPI000D1CAADE|nr:LEC14B protein [Selaginella moellendorffii]|eukprot:XP_024522032.1 LEC14B protein [Selaginella moellendorffii]